MTDRNQLARERAAVDASQEQFLKQIIFPLVQAVQILGDRVAWLEIPWYRRIYAKIERPISLWFARRRKTPVAPTATAANQHPATSTTLGKPVNEAIAEQEVKEKAVPELTPVVESVNAEIATGVRIKRRLP